jgi:hypothetical protein
MALARRWHLTQQKAICRNRVVITPLPWFGKGVGQDDAERERSLQYGPRRQINTASTVVRASNELDSASDIGVVPSTR